MVGGLKIKKTKKRMSGLVILVGFAWVKWVMVS